jgi:hypothetical protein
MGRRLIEARGQLEDRRRHFRARAALGVALEHLASGIHERDDVCRQRFPEDESSTHRQCGDQVQAEIAPAQ